MRTATMSELFETKDVFEDCRKKVQTLSSTEKYRISAELVLKNGNRRYFRAKSIDRKTAIREVLTFIGAIEELSGEKAIWRLRGENKYNLGTNYSGHLSFLQRTKNTLLGYFFDIE
jgi:hypothetical protein